MVESKDKVTVTVVNPGDPIPPPVDLEGVSRDGPFFEGTDVPVQYVFEYVDNGYNPYTFVKYFPSVSMEQALVALDARDQSKKCRSQQQAGCERHARVHWHARASEKPVRLPSGWARPGRVSLRIPKREPGASSECPPDRKGVLGEHRV